MHKNSTNIPQTVLHTVIHSVTDVTGSGCTGAWCKETTASYSTRDYTRLVTLLHYIQLYHWNPEVSLTGPPEITILQCRFSCPTVIIIGLKYNKLSHR